MKFIEKENDFKNDDFSNILVFGDCLNIMPNISEKSIDLILTDLPYGISQNKWDSIIPLDSLWNNFNRLIKPGGVVVLTAVQPFTSILINSNLQNFKYEMIWEKTVGSGQLNIKHMPIKIHEDIIIFYSSKPTYNEQLTKGTPYTIKRKVNYNDRGYGQQKDNEKINTGFRHAKSIIKIPNPRVKGGHPTQKPIALMDYFIKTFTNEKDVVLDCCCGSGTTLISAFNLGRNFIGIENNIDYFNMSKERITKECIAK